MKEEEKNEYEEDVNAQDNFGNTPLHYAKNLQKAKFLIQQGADVNCQNNYGQTPLINAVIHGKFMLVKLLIKNNADGGLTDKDEMSAIDHARRGIYQGDTESKEAKILNLFTPWTLPPGCRPYPWGTP